MAHRAEPVLRDGLPGPLADLAVRQRFFNGGVAHVAASDASRSLGSAARELVARAFPGIWPPSVRDHLDNTAFFVAWSAVRNGGGRALNDLADALLIALGWDPAHARVDQPRLRAVTPDGHLVPEALAAYRFHRDSWYANPRAQINLWMPLWPVDDASSMSILPAYFATALPNTSGDFDLVEWERQGGFQAFDRPVRSTQPHPHPVPPPDRAGEWRVAVDADAMLLFAGGHLHGAVPLGGRHTRFTVEIRAVDLRDVADGLGAPDPDNASRGSTLGTMRPLAGARRGG